MWRVHRVGTSPFDLLHRTEANYYGLFSNFPRDTFEPLEGTSKLHDHWKWQCGSELEQPSFFLDVVGQELASRVSSFDPLEFQWKPRHSMYMDLFEDWTIDQLHDLVSDSVIAEGNSKGCGLQVRGNSKPKGAVIDLSNETVNKLAKPAWHLCRVLFPSLEYSQCRLVGGKIADILEPSGARGDQLVIIMWKKRDLRKRLYTAVCDSFDFSGFGPTPWTMLMFFNLDGSILSRLRPPPR